MLESTCLLLRNNISLCLWAGELEEIADSTKAVIAISPEIAETCLIIFCL